MFLLFKFSSLFLLFSLYSSASVDYYVTYNSSTPCSNLSECGSVSSPFPSILSVFYYIDSSAEQIKAKFTGINIYLVSDYYIIDPMNVTYYINKLNTLYGETNIFWEVFKNLKNVNIVILCNNTDELSTISFRTLNIGFKLNQCGFNLYSIVLDFSQVDYSLTNALDCLYWREGCCKLEIFANDDPCFAYQIQPYSVTTYFNFIEIVHPFFAFAYFSSCEINNLKLPKRYGDFFVKSFLYESANNMFLYFESTKFQNISLSENFLIASVSFESPFFSIYKRKYFSFYEGSIHCSFSGSSLALFGFNNYESVSFQLSNITNVLKLTVFNEIRGLYLSECLFSACTNDNYAYLTKNYISGAIYKIYSEDNRFIGEFYNHYIISNSGNLYITKTNFTGLKIDKIPLFSLTDISVMDINNMIIIFVSVNFKDQNVFAFTGLNLLTVKELSIFNYGNLSLTFFILNKLDMVQLKTILVNQDNARANNFVFFRFINNYAPIWIVNSMLMKTSFIFEGIQKVYIVFSNFSTNYDSSNSIFSFNDQNKIYLHSCNFTRASFKKAGTIFSLGEKNYLLISKCIFSFLENFEGGAVISAISGNLIGIQNSNFSDIFSFDKGGAILLTENNNLIINNSNIDNITAINSGGFLYASQASNSIWIASSKISNLLSAEGGLILLNYQSFLVFSHSVLRSAAVSYFGGAFNFRTSNLAFILDCKFESLISDEAASFISLIESNKVVVSELKVENIKSTGSIGNIYMRTKNVIVLRGFEIINSQNSLFYMSLNNMMVLRNFKIDTANNILFHLEQSNSILLNNGSVINYFSSQPLFYGAYSNKAIFVDTEITEKVNQNIGWVLKMIENNSLKFVKTRFTFLKLIGLIINDRLSQIFFNESKINIGKVGETVIKILDSKIILKKSSFNNRMQG